MEEILALADELGNLIKNTEIYQNYQYISSLLQADPEATKLFNEYMQLSSSLQGRQSRGDIIEKYETENLKNILDLISANDLIMQYLKAQQEYLNLLIQIQNEISNNELDT